LAHGRADGAQDAAQPILLADTHTDINEAACVMCVDGAEVSPYQVKTYARTCILFDGNNEQ